MTKWLMCKKRSSTYWVGSNSVVSGLLGFTTHHSNEGESGMRSHVRVFCVGFLAVISVGCESTRWNWLKREAANDVAAKPGDSPTIGGLVAYLNDNAKRVR